MFVKVIIASLCLVVFFIVGTFILDSYNTEPAAINSDIAIFDSENSIRTKTNINERLLVGSDNSDQRSIDSPVFSGENTEETKDIRDRLARRNEIFHEDNIAGEATYANDELSQISSPPENDFNEILPSSDNITMPPEGEFKDEIDQKYINEQARAAGYYYDNPSPESPEPTKENTNDLAEGELNYEIDQQQILEEAKMEGSEIPAVSYNTPNEFNVLAEPAGEYSDQVSDSQLD